MSSNVCASIPGDEHWKYHDSSSKQRGIATLSTTICFWSCDDGMTGASSGFHKKKDAQKRVKESGRCRDVDVDFLMSGGGLAWVQQSQVLLRE